MQHRNCSAACRSDSFHITIADPRAFSNAPRMSVRGTPNALLGDMQIREQKRRCLITLQSGLTLELCYGQGTSCGLWMFGDRILWGVVAGIA